MIYAINNSNTEDKKMLGKIIQYIFSYDKTKTRWDFKKFSERVDDDGIYIGEYFSDYSVKNLTEKFKSFYTEITEGLNLYTESDFTFEKFYTQCKKIFGNDIAIQRLIADGDDKIILVDVTDPIDFIRLKKTGVICINMINIGENIDTSFQFSDWDYQMFRSGSDIESFVLDTHKMIDYLK